MNSSHSSKSSQGKIHSQCGNNLNQFCPQKAATTFAFSSVCILLICDSQGDQDQEQGEIGAGRDLEALDVDGGMTDDDADDEGEEVGEEGSGEVPGEGELDYHLLRLPLAESHTLHLQQTREAESFTVCVS